MQTNHFLTPQLAGNTLFFNQGSKDETIGRWHRAQAMVRSFSPFNTSTMAALLSDPADGNSASMLGFPNSIAALTNVQSLIVDFAHEKVLVSHGKAPSSHNGYLPLPFPQGFTPDTFQIPDDAIGLSWFASTRQSAWHALHELSLAKAVFEYQGLTEKALEHVSRAIDLQPAAGHIWLLKGLLEIRAAKYQIAFESLSHASRLASLSQHGRALVYYYLGRLHSNANLLERAKAAFEKAAALSPQGSSLIDFIARHHRLVSDGRSASLNWHEVIPQFQFSDSQSY